MNYKLNKWVKCNYEIVVTEDLANMWEYKEKVLKKLWKDIEVPGFRKWNAPIWLIEKKLDPWYVNMWIYEEVVYNSLNKVLDENKEIKFIWQIYDFNQKTNDWSFECSFKLDYYPEVVENNKNWTQIKMDDILIEVSEEEINETINNLMRQYAKYEDAEVVTQDTVAKIKIDFVDDKWDILDSSTMFVGREDIKEHSIIEKNFIWKKIWETFELDYEHNSFPHIMTYKKDENLPSKISFTVVDIKIVVLPEINDETIQEIFKWEVKDLAELKEKITETIKGQKFEKKLLDTTDKYIKDISDSLSITIPKTLIQEEEKARMKAFEKRLGWETAMKNYLEKLSEEDLNKMKEDVRNISENSLSKFFILKYVSQYFDIDKDINWETPFVAEKKLYEFLNSNNENNK